jgi:hypothetical protein
VTFRPIVAGFILGHVGDPARFPTPDRFASYTTTLRPAPTGAASTRPETALDSKEASIWRFHRRATARHSGADDLCSRSGAFRVFAECARSADLARLHVGRYHKTFKLLLGRGPGLGGRFRPHWRHCCRIAASVEDEQVDVPAVDLD